MDLLVLAACGVTLPNCGDLKREGKKQRSSEVVVVSNITELASLKRVARDLAQGSKRREKGH